MSESENDKLPVCRICCATHALPAIEIKPKQWLYLCNDCWKLIVKTVLKRVYRQTMLAWLDEKPKEDFEPAKEEG